MAEKDVILESLMKINRSIGSMDSKIDRAIELHETCPARLGFDGLKEKTARLRSVKQTDTDPDMPLSIAPLGKGKLNKSVVIWIMGALLAAMSGAAFTGYMFARSGQSMPRPAAANHPAD